MTAARWLVPMALLMVLGGGSTAYAQIPYCGDVCRGYLSCEITCLDPQENQITCGDIGICDPCIPWADVSSELIGTTGTRDVGVEGIPVHCIRQSHYRVTEQNQCGEVRVSCRVEEAGYWRWNCDACSDYGGCSGSTCW